MIRQVYKNIVALATMYLRPLYVESPKGQSKDIYPTVAKDLKQTMSLRLIQVRVIARLESCTCIDKKAGRDPVLPFW